MDRVKKIERGWPGHFICADRCLFRRNTLITYRDIKIVVSTVGLMVNPNGDGFETVGHDRYFETMAFYADEEDERYSDADTSKVLDFDSNFAISELDADDKANDMHEAVVDEIVEKLYYGKIE